MRHPFVFVPLMLAIMALAGCGSSQPSAPPDPPQPVATRLAFVTSPVVEEQLLPFGAAPVVEILDAAGARLTGSSASVTLRLNATVAGLQLVGTRTATAVNGLATFPGLSMDSAGNGFSLTATSGTLPAVTSAPFIVRLTPLELVILSGNAQTGVPGAALEQPLRVRVIRSPGGAAQSGRRIRFEVLGGGSISPAEATSDASGIVQAVWTLGAAGVQLGEARVVAGAHEHTEFAATFASSSLTLTSISAGGASTCGLQAGSRLVCWGLDDNGQLGDGNGSNPPNFASRPVRVDSPPAFTDVSVGAQHACALTSDGAAFCWGNPGSGRLGIGPVPASTRRSPVAVAGTRRFRAISSGTDHTCALDADGDAYCWGNNAAGQVGNGAGGAAGATELEPTAVAGGLRFASLTTGQAFSCGLTVSGRVFCWGSNSVRELGDGTTANRLAPVPLSLPSGTRVTSIDAGASHACAVLDDFRALCWGSNFFGMIGNGGTSLWAAPTVVSGGLQFRSISASNAHTCAVTTTNVGVCWGHSSTGQIGDGTDVARMVPTPVAGSRSFEVIVAGGGGSCAIERVTAQVFCWGNRGNGQLGNGANLSGTERSPVAVLGPLIP